MNRPHKISGTPARDHSPVVKHPFIGSLQRGATLVELVITIVIISISVGAVIGTLSRMTAHSADPMIEAQAVAIAESYLEEIMLKPYLDPTTGTVCPAAPPGGRSVYDNICDYNSLPVGAPQDQGGAAPPDLNLTGYTVSVAVNQGATLNNLSGSGQVLRAEVHVTYGGVVDITLSGYRTNY